MRVLVACEFSGIVREAFRRRGHDAKSLDLEPEMITESRPWGEGNHYQCDIQSRAPEWFSQFDLIVAHPPCTHLSSSGARWFAQKGDKQQKAIDFVLWVAALPCVQIAIENPIGVLSTKWRKPDQIIHPWQFGHGETKATCLWLKNLPKLKPTNIVEGREGRVWKEPPSPDRWKRRSLTYRGIAEAMAEQWGSL